MMTKTNPNIGQNSNMFTNTLKGKNLALPTREPMEHVILNNLEESYLLPPYQDEFIELPWDNKNLELLNEVYHVLKNDKKAHGYSKTTNKEFLRMFVIEYYASDGFFIFPSYFTYSKEHGTTYVADPVYKHLWDNFEERVDHNLIKTKWLTHLTFNCVLSDGRIVEYLFDRNNSYKDNKNETMFFNMKKIKESYELKDSLSIDLSINEAQLDKAVMKL